MRGVAEQLNPVQENSASKQRQRIRGIVLQNTSSHTSLLAGDNLCVQHCFRFISELSAAICAVVVAVVVVVVVAVVGAGEGVGDRYSSSS